MSEHHARDEVMSRGLLYCFVLVVLGVSMVGFLTGTNVKSDLHQAPIQAPAAPLKKEIPMARSYREMRDTPRGPGSGWQEAVNAASKQPPSKAPARSLEATLRARRGHRAYDGAPPTIPHFVQQNSTPECLACHGEGLRLGEKQANLVPHGQLTQCNQCHVPELGPAPGQNSIPPDPRKVENAFVGEDAPRSGPRAWSIAPPQVPHSSFMRENCLSCHGDTGESPMRSTHTERQNCTQCHASSAELDLRPGALQP